MDRNSFTNDEKPGLKVFPNRRQFSKALYLLILICILLINTIGRSQSLRYYNANSFNISLGKYHGLSYSLQLSDESIQPKDLKIKPDGGKLFILDAGDSRIHEYGLGTSFDVSSATYSGSIESFSVFTEEPSPRSFAFCNDGSYLYVIGDANATVFRYTLTVAYDVSTATFDGRSHSFDVSSEENTPQSVSFNASGSKMYILGLENESILQYTLSSAYDPASAIYDGNSKSFNLSSYEENPSKLCFSKEGSKVFAIGSQKNEILEFRLSTNFDVSTASHSGDSESLKVPCGTTPAFDVDTSGTKLFVLEHKSTYISTYNIATPFDFSTARSIGATTEFSLSSYDSLPQGMIFSTDGDKMFLIGSAQGSIAEFALPSPYDITNASYNGLSEEFSVISEDTIPKALRFNNDGSKMYVLGIGDTAIIEYLLDSGFDISTASYNGELSVSLQVASPSGFSFNDDGTKLFILGTASRSVVEYSLSTAFDISTAVYSGDSEIFSIGYESTYPQDINFNYDGTKMYILEGTSGEIHEYVLSTSYDVSTSFYSSGSIAIAYQESVPRGFCFDGNGENFYVVGETNASVIGYSINTGNYFENSTNNGSINNLNPIVIEVKGDSFSDPNDNDELIVGTDVTVGGIPTGLSYSIVLSENDTRATLNIAGRALQHEEGDGGDNITFSFTNSSFASGSATEVKNSGFNQAYGTNVGIEFFSEVSLPIELIRFDAKAHNQNVNLFWETATEVNNDRFEIEKSINSKDF